MTTILRTSLVILSLFAFAGIAAAEEETLSDLVKADGQTKVGGFGAPVVKYGRIAGKDATIVGGRGAVVLNSQLVFGGAGYGLASDIKAPKDEQKRDLDLGYGGLFAGYTISSDKLVHAMALLNYGWGAVSLDKKDRGTVENDDDDKDVSDRIIVIEPELLAEVNVTKFFRLGAGGSYRYVQGLQMAEVDRADLQGPALTLAFSFGAF